MIDKIWTLNQLRHARNSLFYSLAGMGLLRSDACLCLKDKYIVFNRNEVVFDADGNDRIGRRHEFGLNQLVLDYQIDRVNYEASLVELYKFTRRNLVKESFEVVKAYSEKTGISDRLKVEDWYKFARIVRNSISHDFHFRFSKHDSSKLPVEWNGIEINLELEGREITENVLNPLSTLDLILAMHAFVAAN